VLRGIEVTVCCKRSLLFGFRQIRQATMVVMAIALDMVQAERRCQAQVGLDWHDTHAAQIFASHHVLVVLATPNVQPGQRRIQQALGGTFLQFLLLIPR